jgi:non-specific serine/threonine protein kinase/serine/threonine-protein kinase
MGVRADNQDGSVRGELTEGTRLGPWRLLHLIGRGGAGEVYFAERADGAFQQKAAIKVLQRGAVAEATRFQAEREILARLEHPGIARLLDGGMHSDGRPYMVMEYVEGASLTEFCDARRLDLRARLKLFMEVCDVVSHAHRSLVVHRDLKPRNILVTSEGRVKLLDFGVAKLLDTVAGPAFEKTSAPLTPDYAAPEQLTGHPITTATDVYALGVVLFELLTCRKPFKNTDVPVAQAVRTVLHDSPPAPSRAARLVPNAGVPPRALEGDLDAIVSKCLRKEAEHRYDGVALLQRDIQRYLESQPVSAREGARLYVLGRFLRRHRWMVAAAGSVVLALTGALAAVSWQAHRVALERDIARRAAAREEAVRYYVTRMFRVSGAEHSSEPTTAKQMLDRSVERVLGEYRDDPYLAGKAVETLSDLYGALEDFEGQVPLLEGFLKQAGPEADPASVAFARQQLANAELQRGNIDKAAKLMPLALDFWSRDTKRFATQRLEGLVIQGRLQRAQGDLEGAITTLTAALEERIAVSGVNHPETAALYNSLAVAHMHANHFNAALIAYRKALAIQDALQRTDDLDAQIMRGNMGMLAYRFGQVDEAESLLRNSFTRQRALAGDSAAVSAAMGYYGIIRSRRNQHFEALNVLRAAVTMASEFAGPASPVAVQNRLFLAEALDAADKATEATATLDENLTLARKQLGEENLAVLRTRLARARIEIHKGNSDAGKTELVTLLPLLRKQGKAGQLPLGQALMLLGDALLADGRPVEAIQPLNEALQLRQTLLWDRSPDVAEARDRLAEARRRAARTTANADEPDRL